MNGKTMVLLGILCLVAATARPDRAVWIANATEFEERLSVEAFREVKEYYENLGFVIPEDLVPTIIFQDPIYIDGEEFVNSVGLFDPESMSVRIVRFDSQMFQQRGFLGDTSENMYYSIIVHEFAHYMNALVSPELSYAASELIAGAVQVDLMNPETRRRMLSREDIVRFSSYRDITISTYLRGPQNFIMASYLYCNEYPKMLLRFLNQTVPEIKDPYLFD